MNAIATQRNSTETCALPHLADFTRGEAGVWLAPRARPFDYSDGDATEERIHRAVAEASDLGVYSAELVSQIEDWPSEYHFSPRRSNLVRMLGLDARHRVLELGCGCGAITRALAETGCQVDAIEGSARRARVAAARVRDQQHARVFHSNFQDVALERCYDLVTLIGVLEYSPVYLDADDPFVACLRIARSALKPGGTLLVAIENQMGVKYFAGISEDHFNRPYYGVEGRYGKREITTYGRQGLERKLKAAGFGNASFHYPFPDYKLPEVVVSERALQRSDFRVDDLLQGMEHRDYAGPGRASFNLDMTLQGLHDEGLLGAMSNSFLVLATEEGDSPLHDPALLAQKYTDTRRPGLNACTSFLAEGNGIVVRKQRIGEEEVHLDGVTHAFTREPYAQGRNLLVLLRRAAICGRMPDVRALLRLWAAALEQAAHHGLLPGDWVDAIPSNLVLRADGSCTCIDREWQMPAAVPTSLPLYRGLVLLCEDPALQALLPAGDTLARVRWLCEQAGWKHDAKACAAAIEVNRLFWREVHAQGRWWKVDQYRHRRQHLGSLDTIVREPEYADLAILREPDEAALLATARQLRTISIDLACVVLAADGQEAAVNRTLDSIEAAGLPRAAVRVLGDTTPGAQNTGASSDPVVPGTGASDLNACLADLSAGWVQLLRAGDTLSPLFVQLLDEKLSHEPELAAVYCDQDFASDGRLSTPIFKPDFNLDLLRSYPYVGHAVAIRREACLALGGFAETPAALGSTDILLRVVERFGLQAIGHIAEPVLHTAIEFSAWLATPAVASGSARVVSAHLERLGIAHEMLPGGAAGVNRVRYLNPRQPPVSIIIPTRDQLPMLNGLIDSLLSKTSYRNYELLIVDNDSRDPAACAYLDGIERMGNPQLRVLRWPHPFNYSAINNFAAAQARGEYLVLLNNDTAVLQDDWIEALLNHAQRPEVGIVGAKLHYPDGRIQHGGVVLGLRGPADHPFIGEAMDASGYMHRLQVDQNYSAVTAACLMIRKSVYDEVGGLDEQDFKVSYNDVDLCLKVGQAGYLTVWTPQARLMHEGSVSQNKVDTSASEDKRRRFRGEQEAMYRKWLPLLARDPAYNRNLALDGNGFELDFGRTIAWQPFDQPLLPRMFCVAADSQGCGHYRIRQPLEAMRQAGLVEGTLAPLHLEPVAMERFAPSAIVLQRQLSDEQVEAMRRYRDFSTAFKVYELDDYLPNLPLKSMHRDAMPKDVLKSLRKAVSMADRFVVSTDTLAEQFADLHDDIRVVNNRLPPSWWRAVSANRRVSARPRVGWAGGSGHRGDLELVADVIRALADQVEWVFLGLCPSRLKPYVHEVHEGVPIAQYPAKLASLNLDLALAPLEDNVFNACKSNLRLLEYGACGFPVVCSDLACYRGDLPVTRVRNRYKAWIDAINMHLADLDATARMGDALRQAVQRDWMLDGGHLLAWRDAWLPD